MKKIQHFCDTCGQEKASKDLKHRIETEKNEDEGPTKFEVCGRCYDAFSRFIKTLMQEQL